MHLARAEYTALASPTFCLALSFLAVVLGTIRMLADIFEFEQLPNSERFSRSLLQYPNPRSLKVCSLLEDGTADA